MVRRVWLAIVGVLWTSGGCLASDVPAPIRNFHTNELLQPACSKAELSRLRLTTIEIARNRQAESAWKLANTMFCGTGSSARRYIAVHVPKLVASEAYGIDDSNEIGMSLVPGQSVEPLAMQAWGASVQAIDADIDFSYRPAGVCTGGFTLRFVGSSWLIVSIGTACD